MRNIDCWLACPRCNIVIRFPSYNTSGDDINDNPLRLGRSLIFDFFTLSSNNNSATSALVASLKYHGVDSQIRPLYTAVDNAT